MKSFSVSDAARALAVRLRGWALALALAGRLAPAWAGSAADGQTCLDHVDIACARAAAVGLGTTPAELGFQARLAFHEQRFDDALRLLRTAAGPTPDAETQRTIDLYKATVEAADGFVQETRGDVTVRYLPGTDEVLLDDTFTTLQAAHDRIGPRLGGAPPGGVRVEIYPTAARFIAASGIPAESVQTTGVVALSKWTRLLVTSPRALARGYAWKDTIAHEYIHYIVAYNTADQAPVWLQEGIARSHEVLWRTDTFEDLPAYQQSMLANALAHDSLVPLERMHPSMAYLPSAEMASLAFAQVATMVEYLEHASGPNATRGVLQRVKAGKDALAAVAEVGAGGSADAFMQGWRGYLKGLKFVAQQLAAMPTVLGGGDDVATDPLLSARRDLANFARLGDLLMDAHKPEAALVEYRKALPTDEPASPALAVRLSAVHIALRQPASASQVLEESIRAYPEYAASRKALADLLVGAGRPDQALEQYLASADINPFDPTVQHALSTLYAARGDDPQAARRRRYERILRTGGSEPSPGAPR